MTRFSLEVIDEIIILTKVSYPKLIATIMRPLLQMYHAGGINCILLTGHGALQFMGY